MYALEQDSMGTTPGLIFRSEREGSEVTCEDRGRREQAESSRAPHPCPAHRYSVQGFIDKNRDALFQDFKRLLYNR